MCNGNCTWLIIILILLCCCGGNGFGFNGNNDCFFLWNHLQGESLTG